MQWYYRATAHLALSVLLLYVATPKCRVNDVAFNFVVFQEPAESDETGGGSSSAATTLSGMIDEDRIAEIQLKRRRVRRMSERQLAATSQWWRDSLQRYAQRRMWMHLGPPKQGQLPERFVRIHEVMLVFQMRLHYREFPYIGMSKFAPCPQSLGVHEIQS